MLVENWELEGASVMEGGLATLEGLASPKEWFVRKGWGSWQAALQPDSANNPLQAQQGARSGKERDLWCRKKMTGQSLRTQSIRQK